MVCHCRDSDDQHGEHGPADARNPDADRNPQRTGNGPGTGDLQAPPGATNPYGYGDTASQRDNGNEAASDREYIRPPGRRPGLPLGCQWSAAAEADGVSGGVESQAVRTFHRRTFRCMRRSARSSRSVVTCGLRRDNCTANRAGSSAVLRLGRAAVVTTIGCARYVCKKKNRPSSGEGTLRPDLRIGDNSLRPCAHGGRIHDPEGEPEHRKPAGSAPHRRACRMNRATTTTPPPSKL
jgi:hypothetical protein